jgi:hypothetical protein
MYRRKLVLETRVHNWNPHNTVVKLNSCSYNYIGVRVRLRLGFEGQRGEVRVRIVELSAPCKIYVKKNDSNRMTHYKNKNKFR